MASTSINTVTRLNQGTDEQTFEFTMEQLIFKNIHAHFDKNYVIYGKISIYMGIPYILESNPH